MNNPYEKLFIYYFNGIPQLDRKMEKDPSFLGLWEDDDVSFLFFSSEQDDLVRGIEQDSPDTCLVDTYRMTGEQWHGDKIEPYRINDLCISPPWLSVPMDENIRARVWLDPGVVFGTGRHQTTEDCLDLVHRLCTKKNITSVIDIGTGTGVLALGAAALGAQKVLACDFNFLAVKTCCNNIRLNRFEDRVLAFQARGEQMMSINCDLMVANIHYDVMQHLLCRSFLENKKYIILSGLLNSEAKKVRTTLRENHIQIIETRCPDGVWNTILARP